jgi:hypothetical protein
MFWLKLFNYSTCLSATRNNHAYIFTMIGESCLEKGELKRKKDRKKDYQNTKVHNLKEIKKERKKDRKKDRIGISQSMNIGP